MAAEIVKQHGIESELIVGSKGVFDVTLDGQLIFSKDQVGRFPENAEVIDKIRSVSA